MKILKIDKAIAVVDEVYMLSQKMHGFYQFASNQPLHKTLFDLSELLQNKIKWALCGGLAIGAYTNPRGTEDVDIILENDAIIDTVVQLTQSLFRHNRFHALVHKQTGVEVDLVTPEFIKVDLSIVLKAIATASIINLGGIKVPIVTKAGLVALKLGRASAYDIGDIESIIKNNNDIDLSQYSLGEKEKKLFEDIKKKVGSEVIGKEEELKDKQI
jgi:hypothetical protein